MNYFNSDKISLIQKLLKNYLNNIPLIKSNSSLIKSTLFKAFESEEFLSIYRSFAVEVATHFYGSAYDTCLQTSPTPRIFFLILMELQYILIIGMGMGLSAITTWVPILNSISGATFYADHRKVLNNYIDEQNFDLNYLKKFQKKYL